MFSLKNWLKTSYVNGVKSGEFSEEYIAIKCAEQIDKGRFTDADVEEVFAQIEEWKAEQAEKAAQLEAEQTEQMEQTETEVEENTEAEV